MSELSLVSAMAVIGPVWASTLPQLRSIVSFYCKNLILATDAM